MSDQAARPPSTHDSLLTVLKKPFHNGWEIQSKPTPYVDYKAEKCNNCTRQTQTKADWQELCHRFTVSWDI